MKPFEIAILLILLVIFGYVSYMFVRSRMYAHSINSSTLSRGLNGIGGQTITLQCPSSHNISLYRAVYFKTNPNTNGVEDDSIDAFYSTNGQMSSLYNFTDQTSDGKARAVDATQDPNLNAANGKNKFTFTIPTSYSELSNTGTLHLVGTYDCVPK